MKLYISTDFEGTSGIVAWEQAIPGNEEYERGLRLVTSEVNAVIEGALEAGAEEFVVNDSHYLMRNLRPDDLAGEATLISGAYKPLYMMQGLDASFDGICFVSYHGSVGSENAVLSHTYSPGSISEVRLNGQTVGESGLNALVAAHYGVPIILVSGDAVTLREAQGLASEAEMVQAKESISRFSAANLHPSVVCRSLCEATSRAVKRIGQMSPPPFQLPVRMEITFLFADMAEMALWIRDVERVGPRTVALTNDNLLDLYRAFVTILTLVKTLRDR